MKVPLAVRPRPAEAGFAPASLFMPIQTRNDGPFKRPNPPVFQIIHRPPDRGRRADVDERRIGNAIAL
jgi:hypothetical protein